MNSVFPLVFTVSKGDLCSGGKFLQQAFLCEAWAAKSVNNA